MPLSSQEGLTLSFGFAVQHVLLSLLGCNVIVEAIEKILLVVHLLVAVARKNKMSVSQLYFKRSCFPKLLTGYKTRFSHTTIKTLPKRSMQAQTSLF